MVLLLTATAVAGTSCGGAAAGNARDGGYVSANGSVRVIAVDDRRPAPPVRGETLTGGTEDVRDHVGRVVVLNFWASWCAPCRAEAPMLRGAYERFHARGVDFIGIDIRDNDAGALAFERNYGIRYPSIRDEAGSIALDFDGAVPGYPPVTVLIDASGRVAARIIGQLPRGVLEPLLAQLLAETATPSPIPT